MRNCAVFFCLTALCLGVIVVVDVDARGGRGRGSFGSLFGSWRKYKKPSSGGGGSRVLSGSPMHTALTSSSSLGSSVSVSSGKAASKPSLKKQTASSYPKQQMPAGYTSIGGHHYNRPASPPGYGGQSYPNAAGAGTFYPNAGALPAGAVFYAQPPASSGHGDFLMGMLAGHMMNSMLFRPRHHITHVYHRPESTSESQGADNPKVIIINNGQQPEPEPSGDAKEANVPPYWPMDSDVPLAQFNATTVPPPTPSSSSDPLTAATPGEQQLVPADGPIVCFPVLLNETDPNNADTMQEVEKIICFPAPAQPLGMDCFMSTHTEPDPLDPTKTIEVEREECMPAESTTTTEPPIVAGEISEEANASSEGARLEDHVAGYVQQRGQQLI